MHKKLNKMKKTPRRILTLFIVFLIALTLKAIFFSNKLYKSVTVEAGTALTDTSKFIKNKKTSGTFVTNLSIIDVNSPGVYKIEIQIGKKIFSSNLKVVDTTAPVAEVVKQEIWANQNLEAKAFVKNIVDVTDVKVSFKKQPDFGKVGSSEVLIILEDLGGNKTELQALLTIKKDIEPPKIIGAHDITIYIGDKALYKRDVTINDNSGENIELVVDSSAVNLKKEGTYDLTYKATDASGNTATKTVKVNVKEKTNDYVSKDDLDILADKVLATIIKDSMTPREKANAIYKWTKHNIGYVNQADKSDWVKSAYQGIKKRTGDCFVYFSVAQELLTRAGIENQAIVKQGGGHYWNMVNLGEGWYHFDTTPRIGGGEFFMLTDAQLEEYSKNHKNSHIFDRTKYPATPLK